jgi:integrase
MARVKLTAGRVAEFTTENGQAFLWDSEVPGLALRATSSGNKAYIFQSRIDGKTPRMTIGDIRAWSIDDARNKARDWQKQIDNGQDPRKVIADNKASEQAKEQAKLDAIETATEQNRKENVTVLEAWADYVTDASAKWSERHKRDHERYAYQGGDEYKRGTGKRIPGVLAELMPLRLLELTNERLEEWLQKESETRATSTAGAFRLLRAFFNWCKSKPKYAELVVISDIGRVARKTLPKTKPKDDCLQREQLSAWFEAVRRIPNPVISAYLQITLLTGARREEIGGLQWADVDSRWLTLTIRDKVEGERVIPLTPYVAQLMAGLPRRNQWVFSTVVTEVGRLVEPSIAHRKALLVAGLPPLSIHGLRRSFGTLAEWVEMPTGVVAQIQGHKPSAIAEKHYRRRPVDLLRMWHTKLEAWILECAGIEFIPVEVSERLRVVK